MTTEFLSGWDHESEEQDYKALQEYQESSHVKPPETRQLALNLYLEGLGVHGSRKL